MKREHDDAELIDHLTPRDYGRLADRLLEMGARVVALKSGHRGYYVRTGDSVGSANWSRRELWRPAYAVERPASATGSGDSSIAGFLTAFLRGTSIEEALAYATCLGWQNLQVLDAVSGIRSLDATRELVKEGMPFIDPRLADPEWTWRTELGVWAGPGDGRAGRR
jgi:sugar/nucleoside kinase (ribokinase family)